MIDSKEKGKRFERWVCRWWSDVTGAKPDRSAAVAPHMDAKGVDLIGTGLFCVQCKAVERSLDLHSILDKMPIDAGINCVLHKRRNRGTVVAIRLDDFAYILEKLQHDDDRPSHYAN